MKTVPPVSRNDKAPKANPNDFGIVEEIQHLALRLMTLQRRQLMLVLLLMRAYPDKDQYRAIMSQAFPDQDFWRMTERALEQP